MSDVVLDEDAGASYVRVAAVGVQIVRTQRVDGVVTPDYDGTRLLVDLDSSNRVVGVERLDGRIEVADLVKVLKMCTVRVVPPPATTGIVTIAGGGGGASSWMVGNPPT